MNCQEWRRGTGLHDFLQEALLDPTSALLVSGERSLAAEFPAEVQAQAVLSAIGTGERTWKGIKSELSDGAGQQIAESSLAKARCCASGQISDTRRLLRSAVGGIGGTIPRSTSWR